MALGFRSGLDDLIESNRRLSRAKSRIWRLKSGQRRPEDEMQECNDYCMTDPQDTVRLTEMIILTKN